MALLRTLLYGLAAASTAANPWESKCFEHCTHSTENSIVDKLYDACESYRYVLPRPKVYRKCKIAFNQALQATCPLACKEAAHSTHIQHRGSAACKHEKNETPRPMSFDACKQGYHAGALAAVSFAQGLRTKHEDAMSGGKNDKQVEIEDAAAAAQAAADAAKAAELDAARVAARAAYEASSKKAAE